MEFKTSDLDKLFTMGCRYSLITTDEWDGLDVIAKFLSVGVNNNEKCIYFTDSVNIDKLFKELDLLGINGAYCMASNKLEIKSSSKFYIDKDTFRQTDNYKVLVNEALGQGYTGLRIVGDRECFIDNSVDSQSLLKFEQNKWKLHGEFPIASLSCYNLDKFGANNFFEIVRINQSFIYMCGGQEYIHNKEESLDKENTINSLVDVVKQLIVEREGLKREKAVYRFLSNLAAEIAYKDNLREVLMITLKSIIDACMADMGAVQFFKNSDMRAESDVLVLQDMSEEYVKSLFTDGCEALKHMFNTFSKGGCCSLDDGDIMPQNIRLLREKYNIKSSIAVPICFENKMAGFLYLASVKRNFSFKGQTDFLVDSCRNTAYIISNQAKLFEMHERILQAEKMDALGVLTSGIAHEFNNLLTPIMGFAQILKNKIDDQSMKMYLDMIEKSAKDGAMIVKRVQEFSRKETSKSRDRVDINEVINSVIDMTQPKWKNEAEVLGKKIIIVKELSSKGYILANQTGMREVLANVLINAVDALKKEGTITIKSYNDESSVYVSVEDNGIGMSEDTAKNIFTPFFTTKRERGTGLGMPIAYSIIEAHSGTIDVYSKAGEGTRITIKLPLLSSESSDEFVNTFIDKFQGRVLLIEDQETVGKTAKCILEELGLEVDYVNSGRDALNLYKSEKYDFILCGLAMPDVTGMEVAKEIKGIDPDSHFILMTGWTGWISDSDKRYIDALVDKPFTIQTISSALKESIEKRLRV